MNKCKNGGRECRSGGGFCDDCPLLISATKKQFEVLSFIKNSIVENQASPTFKEMAAHFDCRVNNIVTHVKALEKKGYVSTGLGRSRHIRVLGQRLMWVSGND